GTGTVTFEGGNRAQVLASGSVVSGTGTGFTQTVSNRFYNVVIDKGTTGSVHGRTVYLRQDPLLIQQSVTFTNGFFWSNADGSENNGTVNRQDDDNQITFLNNAGTIQVLGPGTFPGAPGPHNNSYVVGAVRKIGTSATPASAVGGANTFDFPVGHTPFVAGSLPDTWLSRGYYYAPSGVLDLTANHDFVARYYGTNPNLAGTTIPSGIRPQDITTAGTGSHYPTNVKEPSLRFINESEFWTIDYSSKIGHTTTSGLSFRAKLSWDSSPNRTAINTSFSTAPLKVAHWTNKGSGLMWYNENRSAFLGTATAGVQVSNSTNFNGPFNNADDQLSILPIELISFSARAIAGDREKVEITWQTAWERDNDYFEIEKSRDGIHFQSIARVLPKGNNGSSNSLQTYLHYDEQPWLGKNYYRLKQVDFDGTTTYSKIEVVIFERNALDPNAGNMEVYPNPFASNKQSLKVVLPEGGIGAGWLVMWDMAGREVYRERIAEKQTLIELEPRETQGRLANGAYIIRAIGREKTFTAKVVVE
ncbi:MAG: T9SS type A sorting domain-containing protein, partial [Cytophagales bacterium]|nr:T9SS type A sorting domain-containing protein [Cytophagales bacterium]